ncbi:unnamed protein product [Paramecium primaurelia]|uniref:Uncharacterized protein n=1 Tax=Paramecium primaurelia TaxID=5886 RepID=A0A8S1QR47_PARPR|nr:unnamed protein product [Paramecium primaurelia]
MISCVQDHNLRTRIKVSKKDELLLRPFQLLVMKMLKIRINQSLELAIQSLLNAIELSSNDFLKSQRT